jgi:TPR repeat protein
MTSRRLHFLFLVPFVAASFMPMEAQAFMRVPTSLASDSEHAGPIIPDFGYKKKQQKLIKQKAKKKAKKVDPMKAIRNRMVAGKKVTDKELRSLARSGDDLGQYYYAKRLEERGDPDVLDDAAGYYLKALKTGREAAERPLIRLLDGGTLGEETELVADAEAILGKRAADGDAVAREALIRMYRDGAPFGLDPEKADALLVAAAEGGDAKAALDLAYTMLQGTPALDKVEQAKGYLKIAAAADDLSIRTQAENILRGLEPGQPPILTVASETVQ